MKLNSHYYTKKRVSLNNILYRDLKHFEFAYEPLAWFIGQFVSFIMRNKQATQDMIDEIQLNVTLARPCVGYEFVNFNS